MKKRPLSIWVDMVASCLTESSYYPYAVGKLTCLASYEDTIHDASCLSACISAIGRRDA